MNQACDVADVIMERLHNHLPVDTAGLQRLLYYGQAYSLALRGKPLFEEDVCAWPLGPVVPAVAVMHRRAATIDRWPYGLAVRVRSGDRDFMQKVVELLGCNGVSLSARARSEAPWQEALERDDRVIDRERMREFYALHPLG